MATYVDEFRGTDDLYYAEVLYDNNETTGDEGTFGYATGAVEADRYSAGFVGDLYENCEVVITNGFTNGDLTKLGPDANGKHSDGVVVGSFRDALEEGDNETL